MYYTTVLQRENELREAKACAIGDAKYNLQYGQNTE